SGSPGLITYAGLTPTSRMPGCSPYTRLGNARDIPDEETTDWRAVCGKTARAVRRAGRRKPSRPLSAPRAGSPGLLLSFRELAMTALAAMLPRVFRRYASDPTLWRPGPLESDRAARQPAALRCALLERRLHHRSAGGRRGGERGGGQADGQGDRAPGPGLRRPDLGERGPLEPPAAPLRGAALLPQHSAALPLARQPGVQAPRRRGRAGADPRAPWGAGALPAAVEPPGAAEPQCRRRRSARPGDRDHL